VIFIDTPQVWPRKRSVASVLAAHMISDHSSEELRAFAETIGLKRCWCEHRGKWNEHYDLTGLAIQRALNAGAKQLDRVAFVAILRRKRFK
jgi:hypothetical protein